MIRVIAEIFQTAGVQMSLIRPKNDDNKVVTVGNALQTNGKQFHFRSNKQPF
jgi:hypothetical protein